MALSLLVMSGAQTHSGEMNYEARIIYPLPETQSERKKKKKKGRKKKYFYCISASLSFYSSGFPIGKTQ